MMVAGLVTDPVAATVTAAVDDEPQVSVGVIYRPVVSKTSAVRGCVPPVLKVKEVSELVALRTAMLATGQVRYDAPTLFTPETLAKTVVAPGVPAVSTPLVSAVMTFAVPLQVAVPLLRVAVVGGVVPPDPAAVTVRWVPLAIVFPLVKATVAVAPVTPLKLVRLQVWPDEPLIVPPEE